MIDLPTLRQLMDRATENGTRVSAFNSIVLKLAPELVGQNPAEFCRALGMKPTAVAQFNQMMRLAKFIEQNPNFPYPQSGVPVQYKTTIFPTDYTGD